MSRYVLLAFDDNKEADAFIAAVEQNRMNPHGGQLFFLTPETETDEGHVRPLSANVFVRGLYVKPTQFCECVEQGPFARGKKFGLWVHSKCGKPTKSWAAGDHWYASMGRNLLPPSLQAPEWRGDGVAHHRFDPETKQYVHVETGKVWGGERATRTD